MKKIIVHEYLNSINSLIKLSFEYEKSSIVVGDNLVYYEVDETTIKLADELDDDLYTVTYNCICSDNKEIISENPKSNSFFKVYDDEAQLNLNNKYKAHLSIGGKDFYNEFNSSFYPYLSDIEIIKDDIGELLNSIKDYDIHKAIYRNSRKLLRLFIEDEEDTDEEIIESIIEDQGLVLYSMKQYVRYKTDLDLVNTIFLGMTKNYGAVKKSLSTLDIEYENELPTLSDMMDYFKSKVEEYEEELLNLNETSSIAKSAVRAGNTSYPIGSRNSF